MEKRRPTETLEKFLDRLATETGLSLMKTSDSESIKALAFLHLNRAFEAGAGMKAAAGSWGAAIARGGLDHAQEDIAFDHLEALAPLIAMTYEIQ